MPKKKKKKKPAAAAPSDPAAPAAEAAAPRRPWRREVVFLVVFLALLAGSFTLISWNPVSSNLVEPFTAGVAKVSGVALALLGQDVEMRGTIIESPRFAVNIKNGCNGVETMLIFLAAVLAFPAPWKARAIGLVFGIVAIQAVNLLRVIALFFTGAYFPSWFDTAHTVVWQSVVILSGVLLWILWADRVARPKPAEAATT